MAPFNKQLMRLAMAMHDQLASRSANGPLIEMPGRAWQRCTDIVRQIRRAQLRGWHMAARSLRQDLDHALRSLQHELTAVEEQLPVPEGTKRVAMVRELYE